MSDLANATLATAAHGALEGPLVQLVVLFMTGTATAYLFHRLRLPTVLGFILTGVILGPSGFQWVRQDQIEPLSQLGIIFLLFLIGLELSVTRIRQLKFQAPLAGLLQMGLSTALFVLVLKLGVGLPFQLALLLGSILALSSTAIVLKSLEDQREMDALHGRIILAILIIQDLAIVPLMTLAPALVQPTSENLGGMVAMAVLKAVVFSAAAVVVSLQVLPRILDRLAASNQKEIFILSIVSVVLGVSFVTQWIGLPFEVGALIAGISLSSSVYVHQVFADSRAYRDIFVMLFFVSVGLWVNPAFFAAHWLEILALLTTVIIVKGLATYGAIRWAGFHPKNAWWGHWLCFRWVNSHLCCYQAFDEPFMPIRPGSTSGTIGYHS